MDLIGARELLSSCPRTRMRRCQALRSSSRRARLTSERTIRVWGTPFWRKELRRTCQRALGLLKCDQGLALRGEAGPEPDFLRGAAQKSHRGLLQQALAGGIDKPQNVTGIESKQRDIDLFDHAAQQSGGFDGLNAAFRQQIGEGVDFERKLAEHVIRHCAAGAKRIVFLTQRGHHVGEGLQRARDLLVQRQGQNQPQK